jgi:hypothetical protein
MKERSREGDGIVRSIQPVPVATNSRLKTVEISTGVDMGWGRTEVRCITLHDIADASGGRLTS